MLLFKKTNGVFFSNKKLSKSFTEISSLFREVNRFCIGLDEHLEVFFDEYFMVAASIVKLEIKQTR